VENETQSEVWKAPYAPFRTLTNFAERFTPETLPRRIDRSIVRNYSGTQQAELLGALEAFDMIEPNTGVVKDRLRDLVAADTDGKRELIRQLLRDYYQWALDISKANGTQSELEEAFREHGVGGSTARKAVTFFMHAAKYAGIELSPHFTAPRAPRRTAARRNGAGKTNQGTQGQNNDQPPPKPPTTATLERTVSLTGNGGVTITVTGNLLAFSAEDRKWVLELVQMFDDYEEALGEEDDEDDL